MYVVEQTFTKMRTTDKYCTNKQDWSELRLRILATPTHSTLRFYNIMPTLFGIRKDPFKIYMNTYGS